MRIFMKSTQLKYSKTEIDKAGTFLKEKKNQNPTKALNILSNWRTYHAMPLDTFAKVLKGRALKVNKKAIVVQRLKRTRSILLKLSNHTTMRLSTMQDIGGLRAILGTTEEVYELFNLYKESRSKHSLFALNDYIAEPKSDGYRSIHLVYKLKRTPSIFLEIQLRSQLQHIWATGVEVFSTLQNSSFKSGQGSQEWLDFFSLLSSVFAIKEKQPLLKQHRNISQSDLIKEVKNRIKDLQVIENLNVYTAAYKTVAGTTSSKGRRGTYSLILLNSKDNSITLKTYGVNQFDAAAQDYIDTEKKYFDDRLINVVLVNTGDIKKLEISYPNYFMDTKTLVQNLSLIVMDKFI